MYDEARYTWNRRNTFLSNGTELPYTVVPVKLATGLVEVYEHNIFLCILLHTDIYFK
jgi:hypothetical protein